MQRRLFNTGAALALSGLTPLASGRSAPPAPPWRAVETAGGGTLGVAVLDAGSGMIDGHRLDDRFPLCSTFKWLAAACVLRRVDEGRERLDRRIRYGKASLLEYAPATGKHLDVGMTVAELCEAAITLSDNTAANLLLDSFGGPPALTAFARTLGDDDTRLDRIEPALNDVPRGEVRDTTTPRAMAGALRAAVLGEALSAASRDQLAQWLRATSTGLQRLRKHVPADWRAGDKTGTANDLGIANDVAVFWPPRRAPLVVVGYLAWSNAPAAARDAALAAIGKAVVERFATG